MCECGRGRGRRPRPPKNCMHYIDIIMALKSGDQVLKRRALRAFDYRTHPRTPYVEQLNYAEKHSIARAGLGA